MRGIDNRLPVLRTLNRRRQSAMMENKKKRNTDFSRFAVALLIVIAVTALMASPASAQNYPTKSISMIVPFSPGGGADIAARVISNYVQPYLGGQAIVVENKPGAAGQIGWSALAKARSDGYTIGLINSPAILLVRALHQDVSFQMSDFVYIANIQIDPAVIVVHPASPLKTMKDLVEFAKKNPGKLNVGGDGPLGNYHLQAVVVDKQLGIKTNFISYSGSGPACTAILGQQVDAAILSMSTATPHVEGKRLRALALVDTDKFPLLPDIPLIKEATGVDVSPIGASIRGIGVPKGVSDDKIKVLEDAFAKLLKDPKFIDKARELGIILKYMNGKQFSEALFHDEKELTGYTNLFKK
jgi:tripartite-type tricarboxylate transporter receptor subunit TctC